LNGMAMTKNGDAISGNMIMHSTRSSMRFAMPLVGIKRGVENADDGYGLERCSIGLDQVKGEKVGYDVNGNSAICQLLNKLADTFFSAHRGMVM